MSQTETKSSNKQYLSIVQGTLRQSVPEGTKDAERREWEAGGKKGVKHEIVFKAITGRITNVSFFDGESDGRKFQNLNLVLDENEDGKQPVISVGVGTRYASDIMKKLPEVALSQEVRIRPYAFTPEGEEKTITGVEVTQKNRLGKFENKIDSHFHAKAGDGKTIIKNGFPQPEGDTREYTSDDWNLFYMQVRRFLVNYTKEHVCTKFEDKKADEPAAEEPTGSTATGIDYPTDHINPDDIPF